LLLNIITMRKVLNFVRPDNDIINKINVYNLTSTVYFSYIISDEPVKSADMIFLSVSQLSKFHTYPEFQFIPFIVYGDIGYIEKSFISGSCDFLKNPWSFNELETRALRYINRDVIYVNNIKILFSNRFISREDYKFPLSVTEYKILSVLVNNMDKIISRESIYYRLEISNSESRVIDVYINSLRKKLSAVAGNSEEQIIQTIRGKGYTINSQFSCG